MIFWAFALVLTGFLLGKARFAKRALDRGCWLEAQNTHRFPALKDPESNRCRFPARNFGVVADGRLAFAPLRRPAFLFQRERENSRVRFQSFLEQGLDGYPGIAGLAQAVWLGRLDALAEGLADLYREGGLLHVLALSGQHFLCLLLLWRGVVWCAAPLAARLRIARRLLRFAGFAVPACAVSFLVWVNPGNEPVARAALLWGFWKILRARPLVVRPLQVVLSTVAGLIILAPERLASDSFLLSAVATAFLAAWLEQESRGWRASLSVSLAMPLLLAPSIAFFFAKVSVAGLWNGLLLGGIWGVVWVPMGFLSGLALALGLPLPWLFLESAWQAFVALNAWAEPFLTWGYASVPRPTWLETLLLTGLAWSACRFILGGDFSRVRRR
ncbi:ComEC/Rec2 family competence protein [bacterium]|nr:ComEC/Rec2 family competence protein [bacterium]